MPDQPKATDEVASTLNKLGEPVKLRRRWPKDFHVSPFNSRKGAYTLTAVDPLDPSTLGVSPVNNTINLRSSKDRSKLVARLFSEGPAVDPQIMPLWQKVFFVARWWWVGLVTFPRILLEAAKLFFQRKLHVWYRPEPLRQSIGRWADATERRLERVFRLYLRHLVAHSSSVSGRGLTVRYVPSGLDDARSEVMRSAAAVDRTSTTATTRPATDAVEPVQEAPAEELEIKVLTPAFYSRFVYYAHDYEAFFDELRLNETVWLSRPELLPRLVLKRPAGAAPVTTSSIVDFLIFAAIRRLRRRPERIVRPLTSSGPLSASASAAPGHATQSIDVRDFRLSSMDGFVLEHADASTRRTYGREVVRLFVADRIAFGDVRILAAQMLALRAAVAWGVCRLVETLVCVA